MYELRVDGMTCSGCVNSVTKAVQKLDQNAKVDIDMISKIVTVDSATPLENIKSAIDDAGFTVTGTANIR